MCGIAGIIGTPHSAETWLGMQKMLGALARRGPNHDGVVEWKGAVLGHRRLAIFDLNPLGHQPMVSPDGNCGVVCNGEIL